MAVTLEDLSKKIGLAAPVLQRKIAELGFELKKGKIEEELAILLETELKQEGDKAKLYEVAFDREQQKEIIKSQRKLTAGKEGSKTKKEKKRKEKEKEKNLQPVLEKGGILEIPDLISVKEFAEKTGIPPIKVIGELMKNGILANINYMIDYETAQILAADFGLQLKRRRGVVAIEDLMKGNLETLLKEDSEDLQPRPPIVTVMGHVDHGKSKLIEYIREIEMLSKEAGGITQHIGAYQVEKNGKKITFLDTPGHEAFTAMRARGAKVTDIAILVVAADDGVMPQTIEALDHAKEANVPIIVAINKIDKEGANIDRVKAQLAEHGLQPEDWSGNVPMVPVSALSGKGIPDLLETILIVAEIANLRANPLREGVGTVIEAHLDKNLGPVVTIVVNTGTLRVGNIVNVGATYGKVKVMKDHLRKNVKEALPSMPVRIAGLSAVPEPGDILQVVPSEKEAREKALGIEQMRKALLLRKAFTMENLLAKLQAGKLKMLKVVLKADTNGSLEALKEALTKVKHEEVSVQVIHSGVGAITESDIMMAKASEGIVVGFHVYADPRVSKLAEREGIQILTYTIIYQLLDELRNLLSGLLEPEMVVTELGKAEVRKIFLTEKSEMIVGCRITEGKMAAKSKLRIMRGGQTIGEGLLNSLKRNNDNVQELGEGHECGIRFHGSVKLQEGDILEAYRQELRKRTLGLSS